MYQSAMRRNIKYIVTIKGWKFEGSWRCFISNCHFSPEDWVVSFYDIAYYQFGRITFWCHNIRTKTIKSISNRFFYNEISNDLRIPCWMLGINIRYRETLDCIWRVSEKLMLYTQRIHEIVVPTSKCWIVTLSIECGNITFFPKVFLLLRGVLRD